MTSAAGSSAVESQSLLLSAAKIDVVERRVRAADGRHWVSVRVLKPDAVSIAALDGERALLLRVDRGEVPDYSRGCPGGRVEAGESPADAARREILEETSLGCAALESVAALFPLPGLVSKRVHTFRGALAGALDAPRLHGAQGLAEAKLVQIGDLTGMIASGPILSAVEAAVVLLLQMRVTPGGAE